MNGQPREPEIDSNSINSNAVSLYGQADAMDDFPVLKAFQQYIDSEQSKARKRLISLGIFFGVLMGAVIAVFLVLLFNITERNQNLNDRLIEFAMKERERPQQPVVVQPPVQQDNSAILSLTSKIEEMQNKLIESQKKAEAAERAQKAAAEAAAAALAPKAPSPQELEIERLRALLKTEKEKAEADKAKLREAELEAYRRKHYPECYAQPKPVVKEDKPKTRRSVIIEDDEDEDNVEPIRVNPRKILSGKAIRYFDDEDEDENLEVENPKTEPSSVKRVVPPSRKSVPKTQATVTTAQPTEQKTATVEEKPKVETKPYSIPVEIKGKTSNWFVP